MDYIHIDALEVARKFGYLIKDEEKLSGLEFAKRIIGSKKDCQLFRETCASSVASTVYEIHIFGTKRCCVVKELL